MSAAAVMPERSAARPSVAPGRIMQISWGLAGTATLVAGLELGLFTRLDRGPASAATLATELGASERGIAGLLLGLSSLGLLEEVTPLHYGLSEDAQAFLVEGKPTYLGGLRDVYRSLNARIWPHLTEAVRDGRPLKDLFGEEDAGNWDAVVPYLNLLGRPAAEVMARELGARLGGSFRVLDAGCGSGLYGQTVALRNPRASVVAVDRDDVLRRARAQAETVGVAGRIADRVGDLRTLSFGEGFDAVILSHVLHGYGRAEARDLVSKCVAALRPGGVLVINEFLPDCDAPTKTPMQALFGLQMLMTSEGAAYPLRDYQGWAAEAGVGPLTPVTTGGPMTLLFGERRA